MLCGIQRDGIGTLFGRVLDADAGAPVAAAGADSAGRASIVESASDGIEITLDLANPVRFRDLYVASSSLRRDAARDSLASDGGAGARAVASRLSGRVYRPDGRPLEGARIRVRNGQPRSSEAVSDAAGLYLLDGVASGTQTVEVIAIGYTPMRGDIDLRPTTPATFDVGFAKHIPVLDPVSVYRAPARANSEFARHRRQGLGVFLTRVEFARRTSTFFANALSGVGGLRIIGSSQDGTPVISGRFNCQAAVYLDGFLVEDGSRGLERWLRLSEVGGIEVYSDGFATPPPYRNTGLFGDPSPDASGAVNPFWRNARNVSASGSTISAGCGTIVVWSKEAIW